MPLIILRVYLFICLFLIYLTALLVGQTAQRRIKVKSTNDEFGTIWKKVVVASFKVMSRYLSAGTEEARERSRSE
jgi:hypothetical protein